MGRKTGKIVTRHRYYDSASTTIKNSDLLHLTTGHQHVHVFNHKPWKIVWNDTQKQEQ